MIPVETIMQPSQQADTEWRRKLERRNLASMADNARDNWYMDNCRREANGQPKITREQWESERNPPQDP